MVDWDVYPVTRKIIGRREESPVEKFRILIYAEAGIPTQICRVGSPPQFKVDYGDGSQQEFTVNDYLGDGGLQHTYTSSGEYIVTFSEYLSPNNAWNTFDYFNIYGMTSCLEPLDPLPYYGDYDGAVSWFGDDGGSTVTPTKIRYVPDKFLSRNSDSPRERLMHGFAYITSECTFSPGVFSGLNKVKSLYQTFYMCTGKLHFPSGFLKPLTALETCEYMCYGSLGVENIPDDMFINMSRLEVLRMCFYDCVNIKYIPGDIIANSQNIKDVTFMFNGCTGLTSEAPPWWNLYPNIQGDGCFDMCEGLSNYYQIPFPWNHYGPRV